MQEIKALFITGTDTGVGKTRVAGLLLDFLRRAGIDAGYQKWVASGSAQPPADLRECLELAGLPLPGPLDEALMAPFSFAMPASPHLAAEQEGMAVDPEVLRRAFLTMGRRHQMLLIEGAGGVLVPLRRDLLLADFLKELQIPTLVVARPGLGTINHSLLTFEALRSRKIPIFGCLCNQTISELDDPLVVADNLRSLREMGGVTVFGLLPHAADPERGRELFLPLGEAILAQLFPVDSAMN